ncbi:MAG TPA: PilZ domain-containing protein [Gammaproteobacteria bacterium]|nr:PilZ domain-containing protein [Gammaproteobacteria bacterium]
MRSFIRHPSDIPIEYQVVAHNAAINQEHLNNISPGGLSFCSAHELRPGILITVRISHVRPVFEASALVAWCRPAGEAFRIGVAFQDVDDLFRVRMVEQICHIQQYRAEIYANEGRQLDWEQAAHEWIQKFAEGFPWLDDDDGG